MRYRADGITEYNSRNPRDKDFIGELQKFFLGGFEVIRYFPVLEFPIRYNEYIVFTPDDRFGSFLFGAFRMELHNKNGSMREGMENEGFAFNDKFGNTWEIRWYLFQVYLGSVYQPKISDPIYHSLFGSLGYPPKF